MTKQEVHTLRKILKNLENVKGKGSSYEQGPEGGLRKISDGDPMGTMDDPMYQLGWKRCFEDAQAHLEFFLTASHKDLVKYAGKAK